MNDRKGPVSFEETDAPDIENAREIDAIVDPESAAMARLARRGAKRPSRLANIFWTALGGFVVFAIGLWFWDFVTQLIARNPLLGQIALAFAVVLGLCILIYVLREIWAIRRLGHVEKLREGFAQARNSGDLTSARAVARDLHGFYKHHRELEAARGRLAQDIKDEIDGPQLLNTAEALLVTSLDAQAVREIEAASRRVAVVTALVPIALADIFGAMTVNIAMIRRIAEIYGGRPGLWGGMRLFRSVLTHLVATGAVAIGDDFIGSALGAGVVGKLSRRFGEGTINAALTARVGLATLDVCRPVDFVASERPSLSGIMGRAMTGLVARK